MHAEPGATARAGGLCADCQQGHASGWLRYRSMSPALRGPCCARQAPRRALAIWMARSSSVSARGFPGRQRVMQFAAQRLGSPAQGGEADRVVSLGGFEPGDGGGDNAESFGQMGGRHASASRMARSQPVGGRAGNPAARARARVASSCQSFSSLNSVFIFLAPWRNGKSNIIAF